MFSTWIAGIVGISVIGILVDIVVKSGETEKYVKGVFGLFTLFVIVSPLPKLLEQSFSFEEIFDFELQTTNVDDDYIEFVYEKKYNNVEDALMEKIFDEYGIENEIDIYFVESCPEKIDLVYVILKKGGIQQEIENKHINVEIAEKVSGALEINERKVIVEWEKTST